MTSSLPVDYNSLNRQFDEFKLHEVDPPVEFDRQCDGELEAQVSIKLYFAVIFLTLSYLLMSNQYSL